MFRSRSPRARARALARSMRAAERERKRSPKQAKKARKRASREAAKEARRWSKSRTGGMHERVHMARLRLREAMRRPVTVEFPNLG